MLEQLKILNLALRGKRKNITDLSQTLFTFEAKPQLLVFYLENKIFNPFPRVKANIINIKEEKLDEFKEKLKELQANFKHKFEDLKSFKSTFLYFVNPFICDSVEDGFPISEIILTVKAAGELNLLEMKEDQALQMPYKASSMIEFWKLVSESKYPKLLVIYFKFLVQHIAMNL